MSTAPELRVHAPHPNSGCDEAPPLHRVREVRESQGMSRRAASRRLGIEPRELDEMEEPSTDLPLSAIYLWQKMLEVPVEELLVETESPLSRPVLERAQMLKLMKTAVTIRNRAKSKAVRHLGEMLVDQLLAIMPDMNDVGPWTSHAEPSLLEDGDLAFEPARSESDFLSDTLNS